MPLLALSIPLLDLSVSIVRRSLKGQPIFSADRGHIHHRLLDRGLKTRRAALALYLMALPGIAAALVLSFRVTEVFQAIVVAVFALIAGLGIVLLRYPEFEVAWGLLFRGEFRRVLAGKVRLDATSNCITAIKIGRRLVEDPCPFLHAGGFGQRGMALRRSGDAGDSNDRRTPEACHFVPPGCMVVSDSPGTGRIGAGRGRFETRARSLRSGGFFRRRDEDVPGPPPPA